jgi:hypothetical protein
VSLASVSLVALFDTGSTHNFISEGAAQQTGLPLQRRPRLTATVANGERVPCLGHAAVAIEGEQFIVDLFVMPLAGYDIVMGTRWMTGLGPLTWDFTARKLSFTQNGRLLCWHGVVGSEVPALSATTTGGPVPSASTAGGPLLDAMLASFDDVFAEPRGLPPQRGRDHAIHLLSGAPPMAVRPYRYPSAHKDELERQCAAMMEQGLIRRSTSAFSSSPVLLVK